MPSFKRLLARKIYGKCVGRNVKKRFLNNKKRKYFLLLSTKFPMITDH